MLFFSELATSWIFPSTSWNNRGTEPFTVPSPPFPLSNAHHTHLLTRIHAHSAVCLIPQTVRSPAVFTGALLTKLPAASSPFMSAQALSCLQMMHTRITHTHTHPHPYRHTHPQTPTHPPTLTQFTFLFFAYSVSLLHHWSHCQPLRQYTRTHTRAHTPPYLPTYIPTWTCVVPTTAMQLTNMQMWV